MLSHVTTTYRDDKYGQQQTRGRQYKSNQMEDGWNNMTMFELFDWASRRFWIRISNVLKFLKGLASLCENVWILLYSNDHIILILSLYHHISVDLVTQASTYLYLELFCGRTSLFRQKSKWLLIQKSWAQDLKESCKVFNYAEGLWLW